jgi:uncharacterized delta-60 repeat protein
MRTILSLVFAIVTSTSGFALDFRPFCAAGQEPFPIPPRIKARSVLTKALPAANTYDEPVVIDALFIYTPAALAAEGSEAEINARIDLGIAQANYRYTNSHINVRINPVFRGLVNYTESGSMVTDWGTLEGFGPRGTLSRAVSLRNDYKADIVYLITESDNFGWSGISYIPEAGGDAEHAYGVVLRRDVGSPVVLGHEIGHLLGAHHDRDHAYDVNGSLGHGAFPYSYGYRFNVDDLTYITPMAYQPGLYIPIFSNPDILFGGIPAGIPEGEPGQANNAWTMNQLAPYVAAYRTALSRIEFTAPQFEVSEADGSARISLHRSGDLNTSTSVTLAFDSTGTARVSSDYLRPASLSISFATNEDSAEISFPILNNDRVDGDRTIQLSLTSPTGSHGVGLQGSTQVVIHDDEPSLIFESPLKYVRENAGLIIELPVVLNGGFGSQSSFSFPVTVGRTGDTARRNIDFTISDESLTFTPTSSRQILHLQLLDNATAQVDRVLHLRVGNATNELHILDDDRDGIADIAFTKGTNSANVGTIVPLPDGKLLVAGGTMQFGEEIVTGLARLNADGTLDQTFHKLKLQSSPVEMRGIQDPVITKFALQTDGKILIVGIFSVIDGHRRSFLARLNADGTLDESFDPQLKVKGNFTSLLVEPDGRILVGGVFTEITGVPRSSLARLNANGTLDSSFNPVLAGNVLIYINTLALDSQRNILVGGLFQSVNGKPQTNFVRLTAEGATETTFNLRGGVSGLVTRAVPLPDGKVLISGLFTMIGNQTANKIARLNANGSIDRTFNVSPAPDNDINDLLVLNDGRIWLAGAFTRAGASANRYLTLLRKSGAVDTTFNLGDGPDDSCGSLAIHGNGSLYVAGNFKELNHQRALGLARLSFSGARPNLAITPGVETSRLEVIGYTGTYQLEASSDLTQWRPLQTLAGPGHVDLPKNADREFYRIVQH